MINLHTPLLSLTICVDNNWRNLTLELDKEDLDNLLLLLEEASTVR